jgi:endonuclease V-like protein UPF0215 family
MHQLKSGIKILGIACSSFNRLEDQDVPVIGIVYRGSELFEGLLKTTLQVDGDDATNKIGNMICKSPHWKQLKVIMTRGVTIAGFNCINLKQLSEITSLPVISIVDRMPDMSSIANALKNLPNGSLKLQILKNNGIPKQLSLASDQEPIYVQSYGIEEDEVIHIIRNSVITGRFPEPLRVARLVAVGLAENE